MSGQTEILRLCHFFLHHLTYYNYCVVMEHNLMQRYRSLVFVLVAVSLTTVVSCAEPKMIWLSPRNVTNYGK
jgi:uncharacterized membrane protein